MPTSTFDKTGTLTYGEPALTEQLIATSFDQKEVLTLVASLERYSNHPHSRAILAAAKAQSLTLPEASAVSEQPGNGLRGTVSGHQLQITSRNKLIPQKLSGTDQLPHTLKPQAWETTMRRLCYTDPQQAVDWLASHVNDPGRDYRPTIRLFRDLAQDDPVGTAAWAAKLPDAANGSIHPGQIVYSTWQHQDPDAAKAWIETLPPSAAWASSYR